jgi:hypothetical protein
MILTFEYIYCMIVPKIQNSTKTDLQGQLLTVLFGKLPEDDDFGW